MSRAALFRAEPAAAENDAAGMPTVILTPELRRALLILAPLVDLARAVENGQKPARRRSASLPSRPAMTADERQAIGRMVARKGYK